jgi:hypothetical protein
MAAVYLFGDWKRTERRFNGLAFKLQRGAMWSVQREAEAMARRLQANIFSQNYLGPGHPPDAAATVERKEEDGLDTRTLIERGDYVRAIAAIRLTNYEWSVGVRDPRLAFVGELMEWGFHNARTGRPVPARPHYRVEMERTRNRSPAQRLPTLTTAMARVLAGTFDE